MPIRISCTANRTAGSTSILLATDSTTGQGTYFKTFSSTDLVNWRDEGVILDLPKDVSWSDVRSLGHPASSKKRSAANTAITTISAPMEISGWPSRKNRPDLSWIPASRFVDFKPEGINRGAVIDPEVFHDPQSGKDYFYWGNGFLAVMELNKDMVFVQEGHAQGHHPAAHLP